MLLKKVRIPLGLFIITFLLCTYPALGQNQSLIDPKLEKEVLTIMKEGNIPGLSLIVVSGNKQIIKSYGYSNLEKKVKVNSNTLFELASCSKAFTALGVLKLVKEKKINLYDPVSKYIPWFKVYYNTLPVEITIKQLLNQTSGIPWQSLSDIPQSNKTNSLELTVRKTLARSLSQYPGRAYEYSTINYDILALVIEKVTMKSFEIYMEDEIFTTLELKRTKVGITGNKEDMASGYKIGFLKPRYFQSPIFKGNNAAGYIVSDAVDIYKWIRFQLGLTQSELYDLASQSQKPDKTVAPHGKFFYGSGWEISLLGDGIIYHNGLNPNFSTYIALNKGEKIGVAVLANSNSGSTPVIGELVMNKLTKGELKVIPSPLDYDKVFTIISAIIIFYCLSVLVYLIKFIIDVRKKSRVYLSLTMKRASQVFLSFGLLAVILYSVYLIPMAFIGFEWEPILIWAPISFAVSIFLIIVSAAITSIIFIISLFYSESDKLMTRMPQLVFVSILSGLSNMALILTITTALKGTILLKFIAFYYLVFLVIYLLSRKYVQSALIDLTREIVFKVRIKLIEKILSTSYQKFEKIDKGRIYSTINDDIGTLGESANLLVGFAASIITVTAAFLYLSTIAFWATVTTLILIISVSLFYFFVSRSTRKYFEQARDSRTVFIGLLNGMIDGFKELSLHRLKRIQYKDDIAASATEFKEKNTIAQIRFVNAFLIGEATLIFTLGSIAFLLPRLFPDIKLQTIMSFVIVLLYLNGPLGVMFNAVPAFLQFQIAWERIKSFLNEIPANQNLLEVPILINSSSVNILELKEVMFEYDNKTPEKAFSIGPINFQIVKGEILFIIGGNGSGKTTAAKLITGLYEPNSGEIHINEKTVKSADLGEYFSAVFNPFNLFEKLYNVDLTHKSQFIDECLLFLGLTSKVTIANNRFSTTDLSTGQRKRLALLKCYLEDSPIYLFDEWAADQDPEYKYFFYRVLLPKMRKDGKIVIAITHDDHYFDVADRILKMEVGQACYVSNDTQISNVFTNNFTY